MKPYIEDRNLTQYEFEMNRKLFVQLGGELKEVANDVSKLEDICFAILNNNYHITREQYDDILDFNEEELGITGLYELLGAIVETVFTKVDLEQKPIRNLFLQEYKAKKEQEKVKNEIQE